MKILVLAFGMMMAPLALADETPAPAFHGSCAFEGLYASGCIEFQGDTWTAASTAQYCTTQSKVGSLPVLSNAYCARADYNTLCSATQIDGSVANVYVNSMPSFICKKYISGVLTKRPIEGWPEPA